MKHPYKVSFISTSDCFFYLNSSNIKKFTRNGELSGNCIKIEFDLDYGISTYSCLSSCPRDIIADDSIGLSAVKADLLRIKENDEIFISTANAPLISKLYVRPQDEVQYQLIVENSNLLVDSILEQAKIVNVGETIPIRVFSNVIINLKIEKLCPKSNFGQLQQGTEMVILHPSEDISIEGKFMDVDDNSDIATPVKAAFSKMWKSFFQVFEGGNRPTSFNENIKNRMTAFTSPLKKSVTTSSYDRIEEKLSKLCDKNNSLVFRVVPSSFAPKEIQKIVQDRVAVASVLPTPSTVDAPRCCRITKIDWYTESLNKTDPLLGSLYTYGYIISSSGKLHQSKDILYVSDYYMNLLNLKTGSGVRVEQMEDKRNLMLDENYFQFQAQERSLRDLFTENVKKIYDDVVRTVVDNVKRGQKINTLITGNTGSGKTYLLNALCQELEKMFLSCTRMDAKSLRRGKVSSLEKVFREKLSECCRTNPSVMIIDDLDALIMDDEEENSYSSMYSARVGALIVDLITSYQNINEITFIASGTSLTRLKDLSAERGPIVFENIHEIGELDLNERCLHLKRLIFERELFGSSIESFIVDIGNKTKGYNIQDLIDLVKIADFKRLSRTNSALGGITREDFESALTEKVPLSLYGVNLQKKSVTKWEDIGGMEETKNLLKEMFEWPLRYQELYESCPLRLQCGVLLYGAPGTGKTLIAGAAANEFGLNFISIKGPEVFSKYVGASEQGVRDLFCRAKRAKPCLLLFDEFESLARKRGSSNEDVNDRVVNQLLTELDGVEELTGVFILATTSRPDLLDPALLRPGRIDRTFHCKLPTQVERLSILKALSRKMSLSDDVRLEEIAEKTDGYSGADLQAVLYSAEMLLVKEGTHLKGTETTSGFVLKQSHLVTALAETKPSISEEDREAYESSYETFIASRTGRTSQQSRYAHQKIMFA